MFKSLAARLPLELISGAVVALALFSAAWSTWSADEPERRHDPCAAGPEPQAAASCAQVDRSGPRVRQGAVTATS